MCMAVVCNIYMLVLIQSQTSTPVFHSLNSIKFESAWVGVSLLSLLFLLALLRAFSDVPHSLVVLIYAK